ncbi:MAG: hypothetical protein ACPGQL_11145 [Thermoplasmatota archaeon]
MNKTLIAGLVALSLAFVATPVDADHALGCTGTDPNVCHGHWSYGDGDCYYDYDDQYVAVIGSDLYGYAEVYSYCYQSWFGECEGDNAYAALSQGSAWNPGPTGYSSVFVWGGENRCYDDNNCTVYYSARDTNTGTYESGYLYDEPCDDTL